MTPQETKPMPNWAFSLMAFSFRIRDLLNSPAKGLAPAAIEPGMTVVDYGCGPGSYTLAAAQIVGPGGQVYGVDIQPQAVKTVQRTAARQNMTHITGIQALGYTTGLPANCADRVLLMDMIHMVADQPALLDEVHRLLKPSGLVYVDIHHTDPTPIKALLRANGFTITSDHGAKLLASPAL